MKVWNACGLYDWIIFYKERKWFLLPTKPTNALRPKKLRREKVHKVLLIEILYAFRDKYFPLKAFLESNSCNWSPTPFQRLVTSNRQTQNKRIHIWTRKPIHHSSRQWRLRRDSGAELRWRRTPSVKSQIVYLLNAHKSSKNLNVKWSA